MNKKGAELTIGTLVVIALAVIVLVVLALGFGTGWGNFYGKIQAFFGGGANIDTQVQACKLACSTDSKTDFCTYKRTVRATDEQFEVNKDTLAYDTTGNRIKSERIKESCKILAENYPILGFETCPEITCPEISSAA